MRPARAPGRARDRRPLAPRGRPRANGFVSRLGAIVDADGSYPVQAVSVRRQPCDAPARVLRCSDGSAVSGVVVSARMCRTGAKEFVFLLMKTTVSAIVLSNGERSTDRARESLARQTLPLDEVIEVGPEIRPFHRAINFGFSRVSSDFVLQVDSDMVLDDDCLERLRGCMTDRAAMVAGLLRDPLLTRIMGIKLVRARCFRETQYTDSIATETDFSSGLERAGWPPSGFAAGRSGGGSLPAEGLGVDG